MKEESETLNILENTNDGDKEIWLVHKILRGHMEDVYDLSWAPNSLHLISGSVDNTAIVWDVVKGKQTNILQEAKGFVQGVAWDPKNQFLATLSTDRYCRVYDSNSKKVLSKNNKCLLPFPSNSSLHGKICRLYHDDTLQTFFRRLCFSPDGMLLVAPSGVVDMDSAGDKSIKKLHTTYIYTRNSWRQPAIVLPSPDQYTVVVKFSPVLYKLRPVDEKVKMPVIPLPYRMVFAIATKCSIFLYDTQQPVPFGSISNIHYTRLTDMAWSNDGKILLVSSTDGFCSVITFGEGELGEVFVTGQKTTPKDVEKKESGEKTEQKNNNATVEVVASTVVIPEKNVTIQIPADKIIRSDEKFESPEKKNKPVTPIAIRRHPRTVDDPDRTPKEEKNVKLSFEGAVTPSTPKSELKNTNRNSPKPIAIRRYPRK
jgi:chromatin assembly factor 1 subunit B